jgi:hypothetical protein
MAKCGEKRLASITKNRVVNCASATDASTPEDEMVPVEFLAKFISDKVGFWIREDQSELNLVYRLVKSVRFLPMRILLFTQSWRSIVGLGDHLDFSSIAIVHSKLDLEFDCDDCPIGSILLGDLVSNKFLMVKLHGKTFHKLGNVLEEGHMVVFHDPRLDSGAENNAECPVLRFSTGQDFDLLGTPRNLGKCRARIYKIPTNLAFRHPMAMRPSYGACEKPLDTSFAEFGPLHCNIIRKSTNYHKPQKGTARMSSSNCMKIPSGVVIDHYLNAQMLWFHLPKDQHLYPSRANENGTECSCNKMLPLGMAEAAKNINLVLKRELEQTAIFCMMPQLCEI